MHVIVIEPVGGERQADVYVTGLGDQAIATSGAPLLDDACTCCSDCRHLSERFDQLNEKVKPDVAGVALTKAK
jgi:hypothetical protein